LLLYYSTTKWFNGRIENRHCGIQTEIQKRLWLTARRLRHVGKKRHGPFLHGFFLHFGDGSTRFLQNVEMYLPNCMVSHTTRQ
jgi:hypothetical protein